MYRNKDFIWSIYLFIYLLNSIYFSNLFPLHLWNWCSNLSIWRASVTKNKHILHIQLNTTVDINNINKSQ